MQNVVVATTASTIRGSWEVRLQWRDTDAYEYILEVCWHCLKQLWNECRNTKEKDFDDHHWQYFL